MLNVRCPRRIDFFDSMHIRDVCCGGSFSLVLTTEGTLYSFGYGDGEWLMLQPQRALPQVQLFVLFILHLVLFCVVGLQSWADKIVYFSVECALHQ